MYTYTYTYIYIHTYIYKYDVYLLLYIYTYIGDEASWYLNAPCTGAAGVRATLPSRTLECSGETRVWSSREEDAPIHVLNEGDGPYVCRAIF